MSVPRHYLISGSNLSGKSGFIQNLLKGKIPKELEALSGKKGVLVSNETLERFIQEEAIHDDYILTKNDKRSIRTYSSGEQKKALFNHLLSRKPGFIILDSAFDMLDQESSKAWAGRLTKLADDIAFIQIFKRKNNILPFIKHTIRIENDKIAFQGTVKEYFHQFETNNHIEPDHSIPPGPDHKVLFQPPFIEFRNVSVKYGDKIVLNNINWKIDQGDFWQLKGPNGSGKTTLLTMITGDNPKAYGENITIFGTRKGSGESIWDLKKHIGYVTPSMTTLFHRRHTAENMIISGLVDSIGLYKPPTPMQQDLAREWLKLIGLQQFGSTPFINLTEGQQCLVLIARSMIKHPPLLILDEPAHGLDDNSIKILSLLVNKIAQETGTTIIYVSHRKEQGLKPAKIFELFPAETGSVGKAVKK